MEYANARSEIDRILFLFFLVAFALILLFPQQTGDGVRTGLSLCYRAVIPAVFPSWILTTLLFSRPCKAIEQTVGRLFTRVFRVSPRGAVAWLAGLLSGFPVGAVTVANDVRSGQISREEGEYLLSFVNNTGPAFLVGGIGLGLFGSVRIGWALYLIQIPISLLVALLFRPHEEIRFNKTQNDEYPSSDPVGAITSAAEHCIRIAGFVCFFSVLSSLSSLFVPAGLPLAVLSSFFEVGSGASYAARLAFPLPAFPLVAFAVGFSGLSVHFQTLAAIRGTGIGTALYWKGKLISGAFCFMLFLFFCLTN